MTAGSAGRDGTGAPGAAAPGVWVAETLSLPREALLVFMTCMAQFCTQAAFIGTLVLLRAVGSTFGVSSPPQLAWLVGGYSLAAGSCIIFSGRLGDVFGHKRMLVLGYGWFGLWSCVTGASAFAGFRLAVLARVLQGVGPAVCLPSALAILGSAYRPGPRKAMVFALFGAVAPVGAVCGAAFASLLAEAAWWPWAMWALGLWLAALAVGAAVAIPPLLRAREAPAPRGVRAVAEALDLPGAVVGVAALVLFIFAWTQAPIVGWPTATVLVPLVLGLALFALFLVIETRLSPAPLLPFDAINAQVGFVLAAVVCGWASFGIWTLYLVQILEDVRGLSPLLTTAWISPVVVSGSCAAVVTGLLLGRWRFAPPTVMTFALLAFTAGSLLTALAPVDQTYWAQIFLSTLVMPFGMDMSFPAATLTVSNSVAKEHQGVGASLVNTVVNYGIALGVAFAGTVETHVRGDPATSDGWLRGFRGALWMGVGIAGLGLAICLLFLLREQVLRRGKEYDDCPKPQDVSETDICITNPEDVSIKPEINRDKSQYVASAGSVLPHAHDTG